MTSLLALLCNLYLMINTWGWWPEWFSLPVHSYWTTILVNLVVVPTAYLAAWLWPNRKNLTGLTVWTQEKTAE